MLKISKVSLFYINSLRKKIENDLIIQLIIHIIQGDLLLEGFISLNYIQTLILR